MTNSRTIGIVMAIVGNLLIACSLILQKWVHMVIAAKRIEISRSRAASATSVSVMSVREHERPPPRSWSHESTESHESTGSNAPDSAEHEAMRHPLFWCAIAGLIIGEIGCAAVQLAQ